MRNVTLYYVAIALGIIAIIIGIMWLANIVLGSHPTRGYTALGVGVILVIIGIVGMFMARSRAS
jgi:hypothetical protein